MVQQIQRWYQIQTQTDRKQKQQFILKNRTIDDRFSQFINSKMISLKEHNDLVTKLLKEINEKQAQVKNLNRQLQKSMKPNQNPQIHSTQQQKILSKRLNQLQKQHKDKVNTLSQQLRSKSIEVKDLKEKIQLKNNMEAKQKEHAIEILKKNSERKPFNDHKVTAMISHYEQQIEAKSGYIQKLKKQISKLESTTKNISTKESIELDQSRGSDDSENVNTNPPQKQINHTQYQQQINKLKTEISQHQKLYQEKDKEFKSLVKQYSQLTNDYYGVLNQYGLDANNNNASMGKFSKLGSMETNDKGKKKHKNDKDKESALENLLEEMIDDGTSVVSADNSIMSFQQNLAELESGHIPKKFRGSQEIFSRHIPQVTQITQIAQILELEEQADIVPYLLKIKAKLADLEQYDNIARFAQSFLYRFGMGKVSKNEIIDAFEDLQTKLEKHEKNSDLLDELCIELGAKKDKIHERVEELKAIQQEYFKNMKNMKFVRQLPKSNKVVEFVAYFNLHESDNELPEQLTQLYKQLKGINKFLKEANTILLDDQNSKELTLESILRFLQKTAPLARIKTGETKKKRQVAN